VSEKQQPEPSKVVVSFYLNKMISEWTVYWFVHTKKAKQKVNANDRMQEIMRQNKALKDERKATVSIVWHLKIIDLPFIFIQFKL
jgi:hypothetical protein